MPPPLIGAAPGRYFRASGPTYPGVPVSAPVIISFTRILAAVTCGPVPRNVHFLTPDSPAVSRCDIMTLQPVCCIMSLTVFPPLPMTRPANLSGTSTAFEIQSTVRRVSASSQDQEQAGLNCHAMLELSGENATSTRTSEGAVCVCRLAYLRQQQCRLLSLPNQYWTSLPNHYHHHHHHHHHHYHRWH
eukprot:COSAG02_NODE_7699_length_2887_cov_1.826399_3_plen_188_part_00